jgi:hypothetical protein
MTTVLQNTGTKLILRQLDHESAELCAKLGGTYTTRERTTQLADQGLLLGLAETGVFSDREVDKFYAHPNVLKTLDVGRAFLLTGAGKRVFVDLCPPEARREEHAELVIRPVPPAETGPIFDLAQRVADERKGRSRTNEDAAAAKASDPMSGSARKPEPRRIGLSCLAKTGPGVPRKLILSGSHGERRCERAGSPRKRWSGSSARQTARRSEMWPRSTA